VNKQSLELNQKKEIPKGWIVKNLGDFGDIVTGNTPDASIPSYYGDDFLWASPTDLGFRKYVNTTQNRLSLKGYKITRKIPAKSILFVCIGSTIGKVGIAIQNMATNQQINSIICNVNYNNEYVYYQLQFNSQKIQNIANNQAIPILNKTSFSKIKICIPINVKEQQKIARTLSDTDELIKQLDYLIAKKKNIKQGTMQELLTGKRRLEGFSGAWETKKIHDFTDATSGGTPSTFIAKYWNGKIKWMNSGELHLKRVYDVKGRISELGYKNSSTKSIPPQCILIGLAGQGKTRGTVAINYVELCINQSIGAIFPNNLIISEFLFHNLDFRYNELRKLSTGEGGRGGLNLTILKNMSIHFPPTRDEQSAIAKIFSDMDSEIKELETKRDKYLMIKNGMMQKLLTGEIRLT